jgi:ribosomal protein L24
MVGKDKGKQGNVIAYVKELNAVFVSGLNLVKKNIFPCFQTQMFLFLRKSNE